jgi:hypothetical protein
MGFVLYRELLKRCFTMKDMKGMKGFSVFVGAGYWVLVFHKFCLSMPNCLRIAEIVPTFKSLPPQSGIVVALPVAGLNHKGLYTQSSEKEKR